jgi:hypothetical protein
MACTKAILFRFPYYGIYRLVEWYKGTNVGCEVSASRMLVNICTNVYQKELVVIHVVELEMSVIQPKM